MRSSSPFVLPRCRYRLDPALRRHGPAVFARRGVAGLVCACSDQKATGRETASAGEEARLANGDGRGGV